MFVGAIAMMVVTSRETLGLCAGRDPDDRPAAVRRRAGRCASARAAPRIRSPTPPPSRPRASSAVRVMQSFTAEAYTANRYRDAAYGAYEAARSMSQARGIVTAAALFLAFGSVVIVLWLGAQDVVAGRISGGILMQFVLYAVLGAGALGQLSEVWNDVSQAAGAAGRIGELLAVKPSHRGAGPASRARKTRPRGAGVQLRQFRLSRPRRGLGSQRRDLP